MLTQKADVELLLEVHHGQCLAEGGVTPIDRYEVRLIEESVAGAP